MFSFGAILKIRIKFHLSISRKRAEKAALTLEQSDEKVTDVHTFLEYCSINCSKWRRCKTRIFVFIFEFFVMK
jgi:hypothetical protein